MITCERFCQFEINHLFEIESTVSINQLWAIIIFICTRRYNKNITLMGSKNSVLKNNNTPSGKNEGNTIKHVFKKGYPVSGPNIPEKPFVPSCKVNEKSHENVGSFSEKSSHIKVSNVSNVNLKDSGNLVSEVGFGGEVTNMKKPTKKLGTKSRSQINATNKGNLKISKPSINNPQIILANNGDTTGNKYGTEEEKESPSCIIDSSDVEADELHPNNIDDELYYLIFGEHFNSCRHPTTECLPLSLSEEILNYIDNNQRFVNDDECGFVKKCFMESKFGNNKMIKRTDVLDKACSTNPASDIIGPNSLNVAFVKGMIYRRELYGPPIEQAGQAGPSRPQVPFGTEEYVITKQYNYGRDDPQTSMPGNRNFGCSCAGSCNNDFGMRPPPNTNQLSLFDQFPVEDQSSKNAVKLEDVTEKKTFKSNQSNKTTNKKVSGKKRSLVKVKKVISKKGIGKKTTTALKPKPLASQKGTLRNIKRKQFTKNATSAKKPTKKTVNDSQAKNMVSDKSDDAGLPSTSNNLGGCKCEWPWGKDFGQCPPCPINHFPLFKQQLMKEENCRNIIEREKQNEVDDEKKNFDSFKGYNKKSGPNLFMDTNSIDDEVVNLEQLDKVSKKKADRKKKPGTAMSESRASKKKRSSKTTGKQGKIDDKALLTKKKSRKSKESSPRKIEDDELPSMSKSSLKTKVKPVSKPNNNDVDLINNNYGKSEKEGISNRVGVTKTDDLKYDILFRDEGNIKVQVEKCISGKTRVFTYNSGNVGEEKSKEVKISQTLPPQQNPETPTIADSQKQGKKLNIQVTIPKSLFKQKNVTKVRSIEGTMMKSSLALSNSSALSNDSSLLHPKATPSRHAFVHPSALAAHTDDAAHKRDHYRRKDTNISFDEHLHHESEVRKLSPSMFYESLHPILESYHSREVVSLEEPNYTAEVHTEKCFEEGNKIECLTSIPHVRAVFEIPGTLAKKTGTYMAPSQNDVHVDVGLDRVGPKFLEQMGHKGVPHGSTISNENGFVKGDSQNVFRKPDQMEDGHYKRLHKVPHYRPSVHSVESSQMNTVFTEKKNQLNEPDKLNSNLYDADKLLEIKECLSKMKLELRNECPCLAGRYDVTMKNIDKDSKRMNGSKEWHTESDSGSDKKNGDVHKLGTEILENKLNKSKKNISINENEEGKNYPEDRDPNLQQKYFSGSKDPHDDSLDSENVKGKKYAQSINDESKLRESNAANSKSLKKLSVDQNKPIDRESVTFKNASNGIKDADAKKKSKFRKRQQTGIFFQEQNLLRRTSPDDDSLSATNEENSRRYKRPELSGGNKNRSYGARINKKVSKGRSTMNHPKSTVTDIKSSFDKKTSGKKKPRKDESVAFETESDSTSDADEHRVSFRKRQLTGVYHQGRNLLKGATSYNDSRKYKAKVIKDTNEGYSSTSRLNTRKKKEYSNTTFGKEIPRYSSRVQRKAEGNKFSKFLDMTNADTLNSSDPTTGSRKLAKVGRLKKGKTAESKLSTPSAQPRKMSQERNRSNGVTVDRLWADHRLEKSILTERYNQAKRFLSSKCPPPVPAMQCYCSPVCPPKVLICQYRCPSPYRPP